MANNRMYLSRLMRISWDIQNKGHRTMTRSKALAAAWVLFQNEDIAVGYLTRKLNHHKEVKPQVAGQYEIFN